MEAVPPDCLETEAAHVELREMGSIGEADAAVESHAGFVIWVCQETEYNAPSLFTVGWKLVLLAPWLRDG